MRLKIVGAPGFEDFEAWFYGDILVPKKHYVAVIDDDDEMFVIDMKYVQVVDDSSS